MQLTALAALSLLALASANPVDNFAIETRAAGCAATLCREGYVCIERKKGGAICVKPIFCGGIAGFPCPEKNMECVDDPRDSCAPPKGADCGGLCVPKLIRPIQS